MVISLEEATDRRISRGALDRCLALFLLMQQIQKKQRRLIFPVFTLLAWPLRYRLTRQNQRTLQNPHLVRYYCLQQ